MEDRPNDKPDPKGKPNSTDPPRQKGKTGPKPVIRQTRYCEVCGKSHKFYAYDIYRGKGLYCCRQCAQVGRRIHEHKVKFKICTVCLLPFKTSNESMLQCCVEHEYIANSLSIYNVNERVVSKRYKRRARRYQAKQRKLLNRE